MNTSTLVMLATLAVLFVFYMARRRNRLSQEDERTPITGAHHSR
jgi:hypothetical protein